MCSYQVYARPCDWFSLIPMLLKFRSQQCCHTKFTGFMNHQAFTTILHQLFVNLPQLKVYDTTFCVATLTNCTQIQCKGTTNQIVWFFELYFSKFNLVYEQNACMNNYNDGSGNTGFQTVNLHYLELQFHWSQYNCYPTIGQILFQAFFISY